MTIHGECQKTKEHPDFRPQGLIQKGAIFFPLLDEDAKEEGIVQSHASFSSSSSSTTKHKGQIVSVISLMTWMNGSFPQFTSDSENHCKPKEDGDADEADAKTLEKQSAVFSITEIYQRLRKYLVTTASWTSRLVKLLLIIDRRLWVPKEKGRAQSKRPSNPYPDNIELVAPSDKYPGGGLMDRETKQCFAIQVHRLMQTRRMREPFFEMLMDCLCQDVKLAQELDCTLVIDIVHGPPKELHKGVVKVCSKYPTNIGEDDCCIAAWCRQFAQLEGLHCWVKTCDRDLEIILIRQAKFIPTHIVLDYEDGRHCDIHQNIAKLKQAGWTIDMYCAAHVLPGTDYFVKSHLTDGIGVKTIFQAAFALSSSGRLASVHERQEDLILLLRMVYSYKLGSKTDLLSVEAIKERCGNKKNMQWPSSATLKSAFQDLQNNLVYWETNVFPSVSK